MAIRPPSDLVLDVVRAADPARAAALSARLATAAAGSAGPAAGGFETAMRTQATRMTSSTAPAASSGGAGARSVGAGLEELLLTQLVQASLPKDAPSVYGAGSAGSIWRGLMADHLARAMSRAGTVGLAARLERAGPGAGAAA